MSATLVDGGEDTFVLDVGAFEMIDAEFELDVQVMTDAATAYAVRGCDTSDTCASACASS